MNLCRGTDVKNLDIAILGVSMPIELLIAAALVFVASTVSTLAGFGLATIMIPVLLLRYPLPETLLFVAVIHLFGDIWKLWFFKEGVRWRIILPFAALGIPTTILGASLVPQIPQDALSRALGAFLLLYVLYLIFKPTLSIRPKPASTVIGGGIYGFFAGIFGVSGEIRGAVLSAYDLPKAVYLFTNGAIALLIDTTRISTYIFSGVRLVALPAWGLLLLLPVSYAGAKLAQGFVSRIPQARFRKVIAAFLLLAAVKLVLAP